MVPSTDTTEYSVPTDGLALPSSIWLTKLGETLTRRASSRNDSPRCSRAARMDAPRCTGVTSVAVVAMDTSFSVCDSTLHSLTAVHAQHGALDRFVQ